jgi:hypothetical protein
VGIFHAPVRVVIRPVFMLRRNTSFLDDPFSRSQPRFERVALRHRGAAQRLFVS